MVTKVKLRQRSISKGRKSLYLDFYPAILNPKTGKYDKRREYLGLYIYDNPQNSIDKLHNKETLLIGQSIRQQRENFLNKPEIYSDYEKSVLKKKQQGEQDFLEYFDGLAAKRAGAEGTQWQHVAAHLRSFVKQSEDGGDTLPFKNLTEQKANDFKEYLQQAKSKWQDKTLSTNSAALYFAKFKTALRRAYIDDILPFDLGKKIDHIKKEDTHREHLSIDDLNQLAATPCRDEAIKRAALFSALTGLRFCDIKKMVWKELEYLPGQGYLLTFTQKKTKGAEVLPISEQAYSFTNGSRNPADMPQDARVFPGIRYTSYHYPYLQDWIKAAGITKKISFHCFRHTFATLQLFNGTDIYTVSKMLGHKSLATTQIYAQIVDKTKRDAAERIKLDL